MLMRSKKVFLIIRLGTWHMWPSWQPRLGLYTHVTPNLELPSHDQRPRDLPTHGSVEAPSPNQNQYKAQLPTFQVQWSAGGHCRGCRRWETQESCTITSCLRVWVWCHLIISGQKMHHQLTNMVCGIRYRITFVKKRQTKNLEASVKHTSMRLWWCL